MIRFVKDNELICILIPTISRNFRWQYSMLSEF
jgi:hypothetical protein